MDKQNNGFIGVTEAAQLLGVSPRTIQRYIARGELSAQKMGSATSAYMLNRSEVEAKAGQHND